MMKDVDCRDCDKGKLVLLLEMTGIKCNSIAVEGRSYPSEDLYLYQCHLCKVVRVSNRRMK
jgi:hypothetical protein